MNLNFISIYLWAVSSILYKCFLKRNNGTIFLFVGKNVWIENDEQWQMEFLEGRKVRSCCDVTFFHGWVRKDASMDVVVVAVWFTVPSYGFEYEVIILFIGKSMGRKWQTMTNWVFGKQKSHVLLSCDVFSSMTKKKTWVLKF